MSREAHVRFCEWLRVKIPRSTRLHQKTVDSFRFIREHADRLKCQEDVPGAKGFPVWVLPVDQIS